jgi:phospholipase/carboxylesterase
MAYETGPHQGQPVFTSGAPLTKATAAMVMVHGRGATPADILSLAEEFEAPDVAYLAPQAADGEWYPRRFNAPISNNQPWLSSALTAVGDVLASVAEAGIPPERTMLLGFSQGGCVALEYAARNPHRYGGIIGLSAALIENGDTQRYYIGSLSRTPVFLGCSEVDPHIPKERVERTADLLRRLAGKVTLRLYPGMRHVVNESEIDFVKGMIEHIRAEG